MSDVLDAIAIVDRVLTVAAVLAVGVVVVDLVWRGPRGEWTRAMSRRAELVGLGLVVTVALVLRSSALTAPIVPAYWDAVVNTNMIDKMLKGPGFVPIMRSLATHFQGHSYFDSMAGLLPIATAVQVTLGPSLELQSYEGAVFGLAGILLAWLVGRLHRDGLFGLLFAGFLATSITHLLWSRVGGPYLAAIPHVLAVMALGFLAGRRGNVVCALAGGALAALCLYNHYQARVCLPLVFVAIVAGAARRERPLRTILVQGVAASIGLLWTLRYLGGGDVRAAIWPNMGGEVGNQGETSLAEVLQKNWDTCVARLRECLAILFVDHRGSRGFGWGLEKGGMILTVSILFGLVGLAWSLVHPLRELVPLAITALGLAIAVLSEAQTRKLIMFDMGWQFLAATGLYEVLRHRAFATRRPRTLAVAGSLALVLVAAWSFAAIAVTTMRAGTPELAFRQFATQIFGDAYDSPRTFPVARMWERWMRDGYVVVFVNTDNFATNFATYGGIAALAAQRPGYFRAFYRLDDSADLGRDHLFAHAGGSRPLADAIVDVVVRLHARGMVWWFERPTRFEEWLLTELERRGVTVETWPPGATDAFGPSSRYAVVEGIGLDRVLGALAPIDIPHDGSGEACLELSRAEGRMLPLPFANAVLRVPAKGGPADWIIAADEGLLVGSRLVQTPGRIVGHAQSGDEIALMSNVGTEIRLRPDARGELQPTSTAPVVTIAPAQMIGANCAARVGDGWWLVDPVHGTVSSNRPTGWIPAGAWVGVTSDPSGRLILASADQRIAVLRPETRQVERVFPAHVWESLRLHDFGSCAVVRVLDDHVASFETSELLAALYAIDGQERATLCIPTAVPDLTGPGVAAVDVVGSSLVVTQVLPPAVKVLPFKITPKDEGCAQRVRLVAAP